MKLHGYVDARIHVQYREPRWLVVRLAAFASGESPGYSFYRRPSGHQGQSVYKEVKKNIHPSDTRDRILAVQAVAKR